jgi:hypothetical protein
MHIKKRAEDDIKNDPELVSASQIKINTVLHIDCSKENQYQESKIL